MNRRTKLILLTAAGAALLAQSMKAATTAYNPDDLLLGVRATSGTGASQDYVINLGQASQFDPNGSSVVTLNVGNFYIDLANVFGTDWFSRTDLLWSVSGTPGNLAGVGSDPAKLLYATRADQAGGTDNPWPQASSTSQGTTASKMLSFASGYSNLNSTANSSVGLIQNTSDSNSYASFQPGGVNTGATTAFGSGSQFVGGIEATPSTALDLFRIPAINGGAVTDIGDFAFQAQGGGVFSLIFKPDSVEAIPEPSTWALISVGAAIGILLRRRASR